MSKSTPDKSFYPANFPSTVKKTRKAWNSKGHKLTWAQARAVCVVSLSKSRVLPSELLNKAQDVVDAIPSLKLSKKDATPEVPALTITPDEPTV